MDTEITILSNSSGDGRLQKALEDWQSYPDNLKGIRQIERPRLVDQIKQHFDSTQHNVLLTMPEGDLSEPNWWDELIRERVKESVTTTWFNLDLEQEHHLHKCTPKEKEIKSGEEFDEYLGVNRDFQDGQDPTCRFIILTSSAPYSPRLKITKELLLKILTYHQVSPHFLNFISHICQEELESSLSQPVPFSGFQHSGSFFKLSPTPVDSVKVLGRSHHCYELVFELRLVFESKNIAAVDPNLEGNLDHYSSTETGSEEEDLDLRPVIQSVIYHRFDLETGKSLWIITAGDGKKAPKSCPFITADSITASLSALGVSNLSNPAPESESYRSTLSTLIHLSDWSLSCFDSYLTTLTKQLQELTSESIDSKVNERDLEDNTLKKLHQYMEALGKCVSALESNQRVCEALVGFYSEGPLKSKKLNSMSRSGKVKWLKDKEAREALKEDTARFHVVMRSVCESIDEMLRRARGMKEICASRENTIYRLLQNRDTRYSLHFTEVATGLSMFTVTLLPVSIIASIFSTDLIKFSHDGATAGGFVGKWNGPGFFWFLLLSFLATIIFFYTAAKRILRSNPRRSRRPTVENLSSGTAAARMKRAARRVMQESQGKVSKSASALQDKILDFLRYCREKLKFHDRQGDVETGSGSGGLTEEEHEKSADLRVHVDSVSDPA
ncbi:hypothetical protein QBC44DRAFT_159467 [Cladorrhinum sp. PSN332]|nr:hypothetical protein QBC44DRAFT_159467 [Cladorrhinum sp. PSN332]